MYGRKNIRSNRYIYRTRRRRQRLYRYGNLHSSFRWAGFRKRTRLFHSCDWLGRAWSGYIRACQNRRWRRERRIRIRLNGNLRMRTERSGRTYKNSRRKSNCSCQWSKSVKRKRLQGRIYCKLYVSPERSRSGLNAWQHIRIYTRCQRP